MFSSYLFLEFCHLCTFQRAQTEAVTFLGNQESSRSLYAIPGLDYVAHDDIIPYTSVERVPLQHELFDKFLMHNTDKGNSTKLNVIDFLPFVMGLTKKTRTKCVGVLVTKCYLY